MSWVFVFDLDGVIRHWDPGIVRDAERANDLPEHALLGTAFEPELLLSVVTGKITDDAWREEVIRRLEVAFPTANAAAAVQAWSGPVGEIIEGSLEVLAAARKVGAVCLLTNATTRLDPDLEALGIRDAFDHIFNSSRIGFAKPDERVYAHVEKHLDVEPGQIVYVDDGASNIEAAADRGWIGLLAGLKTQLADLLASYLIQAGLG